MTECLRAKGLDDPLLCPDMDMSDPMLSDDCSLIALCSVSEDPVNVDTGLPLLDTGLELTLASDTSSANDLEPPLSRDNSNPNRVYSVSELQLLWFSDPRGFTVPPSSSVPSKHDVALEKQFSTDDYKKKKTNNTNRNTSDSCAKRTTNVHAI